MDTTIPSGWECSVFAKHDSSRGVTEVWSLDYHTIKKGVFTPFAFIVTLLHCYIVTLLRLGCRGRAQRPRRLYQEPQLLEVSEDEAEEGRKRTG